MASNFYDVTSSNQNTTFEAPGSIFVQIDLILLLKSLFSLISCQLQLIANCRRAKGHIVPQGVLLSMMHGVLHTILDLSRSQGGSCFRTISIYLEGE